MIRAEKFLISKPRYAVNLGGFDHPGENLVTWPAVWYRRKAGATAACAGLLWDFQQPRQPDALSALAAHDDGRYGGKCRARWDGKRFWFDSRLTPDETREYERLLQPMLAAYPAIPDGYDGWWTFRA